MSPRDSSAATSCVSYLSIQHVTQFAMLLYSATSASISYAYTSLSPRDSFAATNYVTHLSIQHETQFAMLMYLACCWGHMAPASVQFSVAMHHFTLLSECLQDSGLSSYADDPGTNFLIGRSSSLISACNTRAAIPGAGCVA